VLAAMGVDEDAAGALRLTLGHTSTRADVAQVLAVLPGVVERARAARRAGAA
jgi:cysteine desulfurase